MAHVAGPTAALAGIPAGLQAQGVWAGRRQLFVRFAAEAETATMYTADALASEIRRGTSRSAFHSISISGRDPLSNVEYICAAFDKVSTELAGDAGHRRPAAGGDRRAERIRQAGAGDARGSDRSRCRAIARSNRFSVAAEAGMQHALVISVDEKHDGRARAAGRRARA